jgi:hypothetical protein
VLVPDEDEEGTLMVPDENDEETARSMGNTASGEMTVAGITGMGGGIGSDDALTR